MSPLIAVEFISLDGVIQAPGHAGEDPENFAHGGWTQPYFADHATHLQDAYKAAGGFVFGRKTYEIFADYWPTVPANGNLIAEALNTRPKHVVSTTLRNSSWANTHLISTDVPSQIAAAKQTADGPLLLIESSQLAHTLIAANLIDEYQLLIHPVLLGSGKQLFPRVPDITALRLTDATTTASGLAILSYTTDAGTAKTAV